MLVIHHKIDDASQTIQSMTNWPLISVVGVHEHRASEMSGLTGMSAICYSFLQST